MATSKTIGVTNVTVSIPDFTDQPDQRVNSNCLDKIIDGVNSLLTATTARTVSSVNLNDYKMGGTWYFTTGCTNSPGSYFLCTVINHGSDFTMQIGVRAAAPKVIYYRTFASNAWTDWQEFLNKVRVTNSSSTFSAMSDVLGTNFATVANSIDTGISSISTGFSTISGPNGVAYAHLTHKVSNTVFGSIIFCYGIPYQVCYIQRSGNNRWATIINYI